MKVHRDLVRSGLLELSDKEYQARVWTGRSPKEMSSFVECIERLFGDSGLQSALDRDAPAFGPKIDSELRRIGVMVSKLESSVSPERLIVDVRLQEIRAVAAEVLRLLDLHGVEKIS